MVGQDAYPGGKRTAKRGAGGRRAGLAAFLLSTTALVGATASAAFAADITWTGANGNNDWFFTGNWDTGNIPTAADNVFIDTDQGSNYPAIFNTNASAANVNVGNSAGGFLGIGNAVLDATTVTIGNGAPLGLLGTLSAVSGGAVTTTGNFIVGNSSQGVAAFSGAGASLTVGGDGFVAFGDGATGHLTFSSGTTGAFNGTSLVVGYGTASNGTLTIQSGADVDADNLHLGSSAGSQGRATISGSGSTLDIGGLLMIGDLGTGTMTISDSATVTMINGGAALGAQAGSSGTLALMDGGSFSTSASTGIFVGWGAGAGALTVESGSIADLGFFTLGVNAGSAGTAVVTGSGSILKADTSGYVGNNGDGTLTVADGGTVTIDGGAGTLTIAANIGTIGTVAIGAETVNAAVGAGTLNAGFVQFGAGNGFLTFNHTDTDYTFATPLTGAGNLLHVAGVTKLTGDSSAFTGITNVNGGELYVNNVLGGSVNVSGSGTLGGSGSVGNVTMGNGTLAPGNSIGILNVAALAFDPGSTYEVELDDSGNVAGVNNDIISATSVVTINGGTVHVTPENGTDDGTSYIPGVTYHIIHSSDSVEGTFDALTDSYAFLDFALNYDPNNVFLTSSVATSFCLPGMTANQCATADGVFSLGAGGLLLAVANLSDAEAPGALDQLSGEIHASVGTALIEDSRYAREAVLARLDAAFKPVEQGDGAGVENVAFWGRAFGSWGSWAGDGNAAAMGRDISGFFLGGDALVAGDVRLGLMGGYSRSTFDVDGRASSGSADTWTLGAYAGGAWNAFSLKGGAAYSWHSVETERSVAFTGFSDTQSASYDARTAQVYGEAAYAFDAGSARFEPFANLAYVDLSTGGFTEDGGEAALAAAGDDASATFTTLGLRAETTVALGGRDAMLRGMLGWRHVFGETPDAILSFASDDDVFAIAGVPNALDALVLEAGIDLAITDTVALGLSYNGLIGSGLSDHSAEAAFSLKF